MATKAETPVQRNKRLREEIDAAIERMTTLTRSGESEKAAELYEETDAMVRQLPRKEHTELRARMGEARRVEEPSKAPAKRVVSGPASKETRDFAAEVERGSEILERGSQIVSEAMSAQGASVNSTERAAQVMMEILTSSVDKDGNPDLASRSAGARKAAKHLYDTATAAYIEAHPDKERFDVDKVRAQVYRAIKYQTSHLKALYLRSLPENEAELWRYAQIVENAAPEDAPKIIAEHYKIALTSPREKESQRYYARVEAGDSAGAQQEISGSIASENAPDPGAALESTVTALTRDIRKAPDPASLENASQETKDAVRSQLEDVIRRARELMAALV